MANMIPISTVTVGSGGAGSIQFNNIPQNYTDLLIKLSSRNGTNAYYGYLQFNGSSASNYSQRVLFGDGNVTASTSNTNITVINLYGVNDNTNTANTFGNTDIYIPNYTSSNNKSISMDGVTENNATTAHAAFSAGLWSQTVPISSISLQPYSGNFAQYSSATLYGIRKY